eukprot:1001690-Amorphochlora_amoeboformis.AAC.1
MSVRNENGTRLPGLLALDILLPVVLHPPHPAGEKNRTRASQPALRELQHIYFHIHIGYRHVRQEGILGYSGVFQGILGLLGYSG